MKAEGFLAAIKNLATLASQTKITMGTMANSETHGANRHSDGAYRHGEACFRHRARQFTMVTVTHGDYPHGASGIAMVEPGSAMVIV